MFLKVFFLIFISIKFVISAQNPKDTISQNKQLSALIKCSYLPIDFLDCEEVLDHKGNKTAKGSGRLVGIGKLILFFFLAPCFKGYNVK